MGLIAFALVAVAAVLLILNTVNRASEISFTEFKEYDYYKVNSVRASEAGDIYNKRISRLKNYLDSGQERFSDAEKEFLITQYENLETPLYYEYAGG